MHTQTRTGADSTLEVLADADGTAAVGWVGEGVLYARFSGGLSASLGRTFVEYVATLVARGPAVHYFADMSALTQYDLLARSAFVRMVLANRRRFSSFVLLTWAEGVGPAAHALAATLGGSVTFLTDSSEFASRLASAAPLARQILATPKPGPAARSLKTDIVR